MIYLNDHEFLFHENEIMQNIPKKPCCNITTIWFALEYQISKSIHYHY